MYGTESKAGAGVTTAIEPLTKTPVYSSELTL